MLTCSVQTQVAKHNTQESCWVTLYGTVYDVTNFLSEHPGGSRAILRLAGKDATEEFDPIHPPGTLDDDTGNVVKVGKIDATALPKHDSDNEEHKKQANLTERDPPLESLLNLGEIEALATKKISKRAWSYYYSAGDDLWSKSFNNHVYRQILLRPRIFIDCIDCDLSTTLLGHKVGLPIFVAPAAMARLAHPDGEHGIAKAAAKFGALQIISNNASMTPEQIAENAAPGQIFGWQLYVQKERSRSIAMLERIHKMRDRFKFICLTLDAPVPGKREHDEKMQFENAFEVSVDGKGDSDKKPGGGGVGQQLFWGTAADLTWKTTLQWLAKNTDLPIVLKGVQTHEDAYLAAQYAPQVRAVILSNHGGRALDTAPPAIHTLLEIRKYCPEVSKKIELWVDGGIKRGTDVVKALCLGARAVGIGRAALFGLGAGGQAGVERTFESKLGLKFPCGDVPQYTNGEMNVVLKAETETCVRLLGANSVHELGPHFVSGDPSL